ncbi:MAG: hypothetical protein KDF60_20025 [Calditrichaeota bacterium]|nr:hypothetical protein [Calditrichota bacterium]
MDFLIRNLEEDQIQSKQLSYSYWKTYRNGKSGNDHYVHGMGQGQMLSLLTRYNLFYSEKDITDIIIKIADSYLVPFDHKHGFVNVCDEATVFEEYPKDQKLTAHVLNGWMYATLGLYDYLEFAKKERVRDGNIEEKQRLYEQSLNTLKAKLKLYNIGFWSLYNLPKSYKNISSIHYQEQHIVLLEALYAITKEEIFNVYGKKFKKQYANMAFRIVAVFVKVFIANLWKYKRLYKN